MQTQQFVESYPNTSFTAFYGDYGKTGYGYGFVVNEDFFGTKLIQHSGSYSGASAWFAILPEKQIGVVMLSNKHPSPRMFAQAILIELLGLSAKDNFHVLRLRNHLEKFTGTYQSYKNIDQIKVSNHGGQLYVKFSTDGSNIPIIPKTDEKEPFDYYIPTDTGGKMPFRFKATEKNTWAYFERNKWKKIT